MTAFDKALTVILREEGGFVNDPHDPGGMTNLGVTRAVWERYNGHASSEAEMRSLTPMQVGPLYKTQYWDKVCGDQLPGPLALCVFDFAVNGGVNRAARYLQMMVGAGTDGVIGPGTLAAVQQYVGQHGVDGAVKAYQDKRRGFYHSLGTFARFGRGWLSRVDYVQQQALAMIP